MSTLHPPFFTKIFKFFQADLPVSLFTEMKDKETPFQEAFEKQNFDNFGSVKNVGVEDTPRISEPLSFFEKTLFSSAPTGVSHR